MEDLYFAYVRINLENHMQWGNDEKPITVKLHSLCFRCYGQLSIHFIGGIRYRLRIRSLHPQAGEFIQWSLIPIDYPGHQDVSKDFIFSKTCWVL